MFKKRSGLPRRKSLLVRLLVLSALVAACSIAATTWLAVQTTTRAVQHQQAQRPAGQVKIYQKLTGYAATHNQWNGVAGTIRDLAERTGKRIVLTTTQRQPIASSGPAAPAPRGTPSAVIDPLHVDPALEPDAGPARIDPRAIGPFRLTEAERTHRDQLATRVASCLHSRGIPATISHEPNGRPTIDIPANNRPSYTRRCGLSSLTSHTATEQQALRQLRTLVNDCLRTKNLGPVRLSMSPDLSFTWVGNNGASGAVRTCLNESKREQLREYVAPAALLFITAPSGDPTPGFTLSTADTALIAAAAALVLLVTIGVTIVVGTRLTRPLHALTAGARDPERNTPVPVTTNDEIGQLTSAFNDLSERRQNAERQRREMVSDIAHELRTPLTNIRGWLEAVEDGVTNPDPAWMSSTMEEVLLLQHMIDDLGDLAAADAGTLRVHPEPVALDDLLNQVVAGLGSKADAADVTLSTHLDGPTAVVADPVRLRQIAGNLLSNALRHTPAGGHVTLATRREGGTVVIEVTDTGSGIEAEELPHVFDRFWRADKSRNRNTGGSGLGLTIVRQLVHAHDGTVTVSSTPHVQTTFTVRLPSGHGFEPTPG